MALYFCSGTQGGRVRIAVAQYPQYHFKMILNCVYFSQLICTRNNSEKRPPRTLWLITKRTLVVKNYLSTECSHKLRDGSFR